MKFATLVISASGLQLDLVVGLERDLLRLDRVLLGRLVRAVSLDRALQILFPRFKASTHNSPT